MGTAVSKRKNLRNDAISSVAAKVRAARAFGEYLSHTHPENRNGSAHLLCETLVGPDPESPSDTVGPNNNNNQLHPCSNTTKGSEDNPEPGLVKSQLGLLQPPPPTISTKPARLSLERSFSAEEDKQKCVECTLQPARVYTITTQHGMLMSGGRGSKESLELDVLKEKSGSGGVGSRGGGVGVGAGDQHLHTSLIQPSTSPSSTSSSPTQYHHTSSGGRGTSHHHGNHHHSNHHHHSVMGTNAPSSSGGSSRASGSSSSNQQQQALAIGGLHSHHTSHHSHHHHMSQPPLQTSVSAHNIRGWGEGGKGEAECSGLACDACSGAPSRSQGSLDLESTSREAGKQHRRLEQMWSVDRVTGLERDDTNWFPKENMFSFQTATTTIQANFRKHLRMVGSRRIKAQSGDLQTSCGTLDEGGLDDPRLDWEEEREMERLACEGDDFVPPKIMLISSKVPKAEYVPTIIRRDDPSIIPILYDHEHATFDDILEEIEKKLTAYRRGCKFWRMLIFCQGGPGHLYLLKNKVATFAKVEKEEDMSQFWRRLSRFMSKVNPEPNLIHIMGCYVLGNPNGEKLFQKLKNLMRPYSVEFESPLELSAQGKEMIEMYFDFRLYRLWKTRQHSKLLDYEDFL
ncbi:NMDA receptor synaptonuclear signaling and neuronal migration factor [Thunnus thynnus]|uniref:NMDA receptor synaptonuclear signaling and neuronal migration factor n=1 Tax=Thunnus thynnus TaxID=8237 RepID=UPI0035270961